MYDVQKNLMFASSIKYSSEGEHGDQVEIVKRADGFYACAWNDGYPDPGAAGGYDKKIPDDILSDFKCESMNAWLRLNFWSQGKIHIHTVCSEKEVKDFMAQSGKTGDQNAVADGDAQSKADQKPSADERNRASEDASLYHRKKIIMIVLSVFTVPALICGPILNGVGGQSKEETIAFALIAALAGLFMIGYCVYAAVMERAAKRVIGRSKRNHMNAGGSRSDPSDHKNHLNMTIVHGISGCFVHIPGSGTEANVSYLTILRGHFDVFCKEQERFANALYQNGYQPKDLEYIWETLKKDYVENCAERFHAEETGHLHFLGNVQFIPPRVREGEYEYYAIDDRDGQPYYVIDTPIWWADDSSVRYVKKQSITYDDVRKDVPSAKFAGMNAENWQDYVPVSKRKEKSASETERRTIYSVGHFAKDESMEVEISRKKPSGQWKYKMEFKGGVKSGTVPEEFIQDGNVDADALLQWLGISIPGKRTKKTAVYEHAASGAEADAEYMHVLGSTALCGDPVYNKSECVAVDERNQKAYYIVTETDGRTSEATHYHIKREIPFSEIPDKYLGQSFAGINEKNWRQYAKPKQ